MSGTEASRSTSLRSASSPSVSLATTRTRRSAAVPRCGGGHLHRQLEAAELAHAQLRHAQGESAEHDRKHDESEPRRAERRGEHDSDQGEHQQQEKAEGLRLAVKRATHRRGPPRRHARTGSARRRRFVRARRRRQLVAALQELAQLSVDVRRGLDHQRRVGVARAQLAQDRSRRLVLVAQGADDEHRRRERGRTLRARSADTARVPVGRDRRRPRSRRSAIRTRSQGRSPRPGARQAPAGGSSARAEV